MHALQFVNEFADFTGQDYASLRVIDRALAEAGLRRKASGKRLPDITRFEAVMFLLAVLAHDQPTLASRAAAEVGKHRLMIGENTRKEMSLLAKTVDLPASELPNLILANAVMRVCASLLRRPDAFAELAVDRNGPAILQLWDSQKFGADGPAVFRFVGTIETRVPKILTETRTASTELLQWIAEETFRTADGSEAGPAE
jgi:hypothetical protein